MDLSDLSDVGDLGDLGDVGDLGDLGDLEISELKNPKIRLTKKRKFPKLRNRIFESLEMRLYGEGAGRK